MLIQILKFSTVAPYTGAWIEIVDLFDEETGLPVAPYTGAWIEIDYVVDFNQALLVAPYTGAWIEIVIFRSSIASIKSHPTRVRGLKYCYTLIN